MAARGRRKSASPSASRDSAAASSTSWSRFGQSSAACSGPTARLVTQATAVVIVFCILAGLYLAIFDWVFSRLVKAIL